MYKETVFFIICFPEIKINLHLKIYHRIIIGVCSVCVFIHVVLFDVNVAMTIDINTGIHNNSGRIMLLSIIPMIRSDIINESFFISLDFDNRTETIIIEMAKPT